MHRYRLLKKQNYFHALFDKKSVEVFEKDGNEVVKISWYASTIDKDRVWDVVLPWAFVDTLATYKENPIILLQHKMDKPIWKATELSVDEKGLKIEAEITEDIDWVKSAIKNGVLKGFSIWYRVKDWEEKGNEEGIYYEIKEVELMEISVVSVPANPFTLIKSLEDSFEEIKEKDSEWEDPENEEEENNENKKSEEEEEQEEDNEDTTTETWSEWAEKDGENPSIEPDSEPQEEWKELRDMSMKMMLKQLEVNTSEMKAELEKDLSEKMHKSLWDNAESIKSSLLEEVNNKFTEYSKGQLEAITILVDSMKSLDEEFEEMFTLIKTLRNTKWYNYEKPVKVASKKQDKLSKALSLAKNNI